MRAETVRVVSQRPSCCAVICSQVHDLSESRLCAQEKNRRRDVVWRARASASEMAPATGSGGRRCEVEEALLKFVC